LLVVRVAMGLVSGFFFARFVGGGWEVERHVSASVGWVALAAPWHGNHAPFTTFLRLATGCSPAAPKRMRFVDFPIVSSLLVSLSR